MPPLRLIGTTALSFALAVPMAPAFATAPAFSGARIDITTTTATDSLLIDVKQGRSGTGKRGRDRRRDRDDDHRGRRDKRGGKHDSGSGRSRPRIPGGSGCDDPRDLLEHPECSL